MPEVSYHKVTQMPDPAVADAVYFVRTAEGMRLVVTDANADPVDLEPPVPAQFAQTFAEAAAWTVNHNLGRRPAAVAVLSVGGVEVEALIVHTNDNQLQVMLNPPMAGSVIVT